MPQGYEVRGAQDFVLLSRALRSQDSRELKKKFTKAIKKAAGPAVDDARRAARSIDVKSARGGGTAARRRYAESRSKSGRTRGSHSLREAVARAVTVQQRSSGPTAGVRIRVNPARMPPDQRNLALDLDKPGGWRHPVFGHRSVWVQQVGQPYWFETSVGRHAPQIRQDIVDILDDVKREILSR